MAAQGSMSDLARGEPVLWEGQPDASRVFSRGDVVLVPFYLVFLGFSVVFTTMAMSDGAPALPVVIGIVFVAIGLFFAVGRFVVKSWVNARTRYAVTPTRAIVRGPRTTREVGLTGASPVITTSNAGDLVTVVFPSGSEPRGGLFGSRATAQEQLRNSGLDAIVGGFSPAFYDVRDVDGLRRALERAAQLRRGSRA